MRMEEKKKLTAKQEVVCSLAATGMSNSKIAEKVGASSKAVAALLERNDVQVYVKKLRGDIFGWEPKRVYRSVFPKAFETAEKLMNDEGVKPAVRLNAAQDFMDRASGKPTQNVEVGGSLVRDLLEALKGNEKEVKTVEAEFEEIKEKDQIDSFLED